MRRIRLVLVLSIGLVTLAAQPAGAGGPRGPDDSTVLATVGKEKISVGSFRHEMALRGGRVPGQFSTLEQRRALLDEMIRFKTRVARARAAGYDRDPDVIAIFERAMVDAYRRNRPVSREALVVTDEDVAAYYSQHRSDYDRPARSLGAIVFFAARPHATPEKKKELEARVRQALEEARELGPEIRDFGPVARTYSEDRASRYTGGVIGWLVNHPGRRSRWEKPVVDAIFALKEPGQIGDIVQTDRGYYLVRLVDREQSSPRPLDEVADGIRHHLMSMKNRAAEEALDAEVRKGLDIKINEEILVNIEGPPPAAETADDLRPPQLPPG